MWEFGGLWNELAWRRKPEIDRTNLCISESGEKLWLYKAEDAVLMLEVKPDPSQVIDPAHGIGQVVLKRLISAEQVVDLLCSTTAELGMSQ